MQYQYLPSLYWSFWGDFFITKVTCFYQINAILCQEHHWQLTETVRERERERGEQQMLILGKSMSVPLCLNPENIGLKQFLKIKGRQSPLCYPACLLPYSAFSKLLSHTIQYNTIQ